MTEYLLALDAGSGSGRSVLLSTDGRECHTASREWAYQYEPDAGPMACHFDPESFWSTLVATIREVLEKAGAHGRQVLAVSSTSQREGCLLIDGQGCEIYAGPNRDYRGLVEGGEMARMLGEEIYVRTGHYPSGIFAAARLRWFRDHRPEVYERAAKLIMINDWVLYRLSDALASEPTNAAETCLFDIRKGTWADDLIEGLGLRRELFAEVVPPGTRIAGVSPAAGRLTGLVPGTPVVTGGADTQCGVLGSGGIRSGDMVVVAGTTAPLQLVLPTLALDPGRRLWSSPFLAPESFVLESNAGSAGTVYRWFRDAFCDADVRPAAGEDPSAFGVVDELAGSTPPGAWGSRSFVGVMIMDAKATAGPRATLEVGSLHWPDRTRASLARAVLESLAFAVRANADQISNVAPDGITQVAACGGLTRSRLYAELLAACLERVVRIPRWREGSGVGAAICAGLGAGVYTSLEEGQRQLVAIDGEVEPDPSLVSAYRDLYPAWLRGYGALEAHRSDSTTQVNGG